MGYPVVGCVFPVKAEYIFGRMIGYVPECSLFSVKSALVRDVIGNLDETLLPSFDCNEVDLPVSEFPVSDRIPPEEQFVVYDTFQCERVIKFKDVS